MNISRIPPWTDDGNVNVIVEIPRGSMNKYEYDEELGITKLDRVLYSAVHYPTEYGFVPCTKGGDGELQDVMVLVEQPTFPGCLVETRLIGVLTIEHSSGMPEQKLLGVPVREPRFAEYGDITDVPQHLLKEMSHFFDVFKDLQDSQVRAGEWQGADVARRTLEDAIAAYGDGH